MRGWIGHSFGVQRGWSCYPRCYRSFLRIILEHVGIEEFVTVTSAQSIRCWRKPWTLVLFRIVSDHTGENRSGQRDAAARETFRFRSQVNWRLQRWGGTSFIDRKRTPCCYTFFGLSLCRAPSRHWMTKVQTTTVSIAKTSVRPKHWWTDYSGHIWYWFLM